MVYINGMFANPLHIAVFFVASYSSVAVAQLISAAAADSQRNKEIWVLNPDSLSSSSIPDSVFYTAAKLPSCMDMGNGCLNENFNYDKVKDGIERDKCRNGDEDCYLTKNAKLAEPFVDAFAQPFIYNHEKRERQSNKSSKK